MDIRNFFEGGKGAGGKKKKNVSSESDAEAVIKKEESSATEQNVEIARNGNRSKRIIDDDDDDDDDDEAVHQMDTSNHPSEDTMAVDQPRAPIFSETPTVQTTKKSDKEKIGQISSAFNISSKSSSSMGEENPLSKSVIPDELKGIITWKPKDPVPYSAVSAAFDQIGAVTSRLDKENILCKLYRAVAITTPSDLESIVYLTSNTVYPAFAGLELGIGDALLVKAVVEATGRNRAAVQAAYREQGDLGIVACQSRQNQSMLSFGAKPKPLTARFVLEQLRLITNTTGGKSMDRKVGIIKKMMIACQGDEAKYIVRALQGKLRIGIANKTVLIGLAKAFATPSQKVVVSQPFEPEEVEGDSQYAHGDSPSSTLDDLISLTDSEKLDATSTSGSQKLTKWLSSITVSPPQEAVTLRNAASRSVRLTKEERNECAMIAVKRAFSECPSLEILTKSLLQYPIYDIHQYCRLTPGVPVAPMLAKPTKAISEVLKRLNGLNFTMEYKYDGERAQVHLLSDGSVKIFSRNSEDNSQKYPEFLDVFRKAKRDVVTTCVVDAEVVAYDREKDCLLPFQVLSTRKRKVEDGDEDQKVKVILQAFDILYLNGKSLLQLPLLQRRNLLHSSFVHNQGYFHFASGADHLENGDTTPIEVFMQEACQAMCEGLMVKTLSSNATYDPSKRSLNWLKLKKDYIDGMGVCDSVDLVVMGGYHGRGKRTNVYGAYLMGCYDPDEDEYQSVCKVGTGFKDEDLTIFFEQMSQHTVESGRKPSNYNVGDSLTPDDWFEPVCVWEVQAADLSKSSVHKGGIGKVDAGRGIGLRFPRFLRERPDKKPEMATTAEQIVDIYESQGDQFDANGGTEDVDDDDLL